ncbi:4'-phosphopantetheinyl transferase superfamily protein [Apibacter muscae]|uniref:4'-phosphopantetheinyl transferase superfamily protein n=1 Tax=Apibacter muscae TaxID=2509004 RepID=A0A563DI05_9FLAO|nr:4'-phosphopantetheinyl transferase superfamily protein [Apibacter muscae]TWP29709.1 4'-phosphopantetheinyl transferase superfamily protein [Apibacter muscae]
MKIFYSFIPDQSLENTLLSYLKILPTGIQSKIYGFKNTEDALRSLLGYALLINGAKYFGYSSSFVVQNMIYNPYKKPYLKNNPIFFNISHSKELAVCIINSTNEVGIDVEAIVPIEIEDYQECFTSSEWHQIFQNNNSLKNFYELWTEKEAVLKAESSGLNISLNSFEIINQNCFMDGNNYSIHMVDIHEDYVCKFAIKNPSKPMNYQALHIPFK